MTPFQEWQAWREKPWSLQKKKWALDHDVITLKDFAIAVGYSYSSIRRKAKFLGVEPLPFGGYSTEELCRKLKIKRS